MFVVFFEASSPINSSCKKKQQETTPIAHKLFDFYFLLSKLISFNEDSSATENSPESFKVLTTLNN